MNLCHACKQAVVLDPHVPVGRRDTCPNCYADLRCCLNCCYHDPGRQNECMEPFSEQVRDRSGGNFCGFFRFSEGEHAREADVDSARAKLDDLFKTLK